jgi:serine/threonine-protein kinase
MLTREGDAALTPKHAAPEQVTGGRITTATDVYSLGVLLFELLSGQHPTGVDARSPAEFVKAVADTEPQRLSTALDEATDPELATTLAAKRATTPERLRRMLQGDLDTIVGKALKNDPAERYASVAEFADDLRRFVEHQPIAARPDAVGYRLGKFIRRHRRSVAIACAAALAIVGLVAFYGSRLAAERDRARLQAEKASRVSELLTSLLRGADPYRTPDAREPTVQNLLDVGAERVAAELQDQPEVQAQMFTVIGRTYDRMGLNAKALPLLQRALAIGRSALGPEHVQVATSLNDLGVLNRELGNVAEAEALLRESLAMRRRLLATNDNDIAITLVELARVLNDRGRPAEAEPLAREALAIRRNVYGDEHRETATSKNELGVLLLRRGDLAGAEPLLRENAATTGRVLGADHPNTAWSKVNLAVLRNAQGHHAVAETLVREALAISTKVFGDQHPEYAQMLNTLADTAEIRGRLDEAQILFAECLRIGRARLSGDHPRTLTYAVNLARIQIASGQASTAETSLRHVLQVRERLYPPQDWRLAQARSLLGAALLARGRYAEAEPLMLAAAAVLQPLPGGQARERTANRARLVALYQATGRPHEAAAYR